MGRISSPNFGRFFLLVGVVLVMNPKYTHGCRTLAHHLVNHGFGVLFLNKGALN